MACSKKETLYDIGQIKTEKGEVLIWLYDQTPKHKENFIKLANAGYWDTFSFNRVIKDFVAQGGCPDTPEGFADSPYAFCRVPVLHRAKQKRPSPPR